MTEDFPDLNKIRDEAIKGEKDPLYDSQLNDDQYSYYSNLPREELERIAEESETTPEMFLDSIKMLDNIRKIHKQSRDNEK